MHLGLKWRGHNLEWFLRRKIFLISPLIGKRNWSASGVSILPILTITGVPMILNKRYAR